MEKTSVLLYEESSNNLIGSVLYTSYTDQSKIKPLKILNSIKLPTSS